MCGYRPRLIDLYLKRACIEHIVNVADFVAMISLWSVWAQSNYDNPWGQASIFKTLEMRFGRELDEPIENLKIKNVS
jgi:hypothetical protein